MSIIDEQNILGNPALATATRPGKSTLAADYSFVRAAEIKEEKTQPNVPEWIKPNSYAPSVDMAEATDAPPAPVTGPAGEPELSSPTEYGTQGGEALTENAEQTTSLGQVAEVIAEEKEATNFVVGPMYSFAITSETITEEGEQGPIASGGQFNGYEAQNQYFQNPQANRGAGATTVPAPIESTGIRGQVSVSPMEALAAAQSPGDDNPQANRGATNSGGSDNPQANRGQRNKTTGPSAKKSQQPGAQAPRVHKAAANSQANRGAAAAATASTAADVGDQSGRGS